MISDGVYESMVAQRDELQRCVEDLKRERNRARDLARNLFNMIDRETWRNQGGDDGQGHYEGDGYAERINVEIRSWPRQRTETPHRGGGMKDETYRDEFVAPGESILEILERVDRVCSYLASTPIKNTAVPVMIAEALSRANALRVPFSEAIHNPESRHYKASGSEGDTA